MKTSFLKLLSLAAVIGVTGVYAQTSDPVPGAGSDNGIGTRLREHAPADVTLPGRDNLPTEMQDLVDRFQAQRQEWVANRRAVLARLQNMTEEERAAAIATLREQQRDQVRQQRELAREIRDQMRELRNTRRGAGNGGG